MKHNNFSRKARERSKPTANTAVRKRGVGSINEQPVNLEPVNLFPHVKVVRPTRASRLYERAE
jgi:hypothetical protein